MTAGEMPSGIGSIYEACKFFELSLRQTSQANALSSLHNTPSTSSIKGERREREKQKSFASTIYIRR